MKKTQKKAGDSERHSTAKTTTNKRGSGRKSHQAESYRWEGSQRGRRPPLRPPGAPVREKGVKQTSKKRIGEERLVIGKRAALELARHAPERIVELLLAAPQPLAPEVDGGLLPEPLAGYPRRTVAEEELTRRAGSASHQGIGVIVRARHELSMKEAEVLWRDAPEVLVLAIDGVVDPHNFGAILRSAECFGCSAVMVSSNRGCPITPTVTKTSAGASELVPIIRVANLAQSIDRLGKLGFWSVVSGLVPGAQSIYEAEFLSKVILVVGGEGRGVQSLLINRADVVVQIPMLGEVGSLNVAQATAVLLSHYWAKNRRPNLTGIRSAVPS